ncbi:MAG: shikimate kinase [Lentimicrobiaceae bacterium]|nr:shikimate kinase [Lentimicrobiaceae bacterium]
MKTYLIGFMGCGKSTVGKRLAAYCNCSFADTDELFETKLNRSINSYFEHYGEESFRKEESLILRGTASLENTVIAVGGGTPCFYDNMDWILSQGVCVYLEMPPKALLDRLQNSKSARPLLKTDNLLENIQNLLSQREPYYKKASITFSGLDVDISKLYKEIYRYSYSA